MAVPEHIRKKLTQLPHKPGVYLMKDRFGRVIYVGKARDLRRRVSQYFQPSRRMSWDPKFNALVEAIHDFDVHTVRTESEAILLEGKLIKELKPRYNISFRDDKRFLLVKVNLNDPIPNFVLTRLRKDDGALYFGPFASSTAIRNTLSLMRRMFNLRGCSAYTPGPDDYKHCMYAHLRYCTAPCIGNVSREQYMDQVRAACEFLTGRCIELKSQLEKEMWEAASAQDYERAARLRDMIADLELTTRREEKFERIPYSLPILKGSESELLELQKVLGLPTTPRRIEAFDISNIGGSYAVASMVAFQDGRPDRSAYRRYRIKTVPGQDDFAAMAEVVRRRYSRLLAETKTQAFRSTQATCADKEDAGEPIPEELQKLINETSAKFKTGCSALKSPVKPQTSTESPSTRSGPALPDLILIDGGKGQLNAARAELTNLGLSNIPVVALAKEFEELYLPGKPEPLRLPFDSPALKLLQRIRDESHRVAHSYNAQLRLKKITESILDEFPGIGEKRKQLLLKKFGSVQRIAAATTEEIAQIPGIGEKLAAELKQFLLARFSNTPENTLHSTSPDTRSATHNGTSIPHPLI